MSDAYLFLGLATVFGAVLVGLLALVTGTSTKERALASLEAQVGAESSNLREVELSRSFADRALHPLLVRWGQLARRLTPVGSIRKLERQIVLAGSPRGWDVGRISVAKFAGLVLGAVLGMMVVRVLGSTGVQAIVVVLVVTAMGFIAPNAVIARKVEERQLAIRRSLPDTIDLLTISVEAGLGFDAALTEVTRNVPGPLSAEIGRMLQEMQLGVGRTDALRDLAARTEVEDLNAFVLAMVQAETFGVSVANVLRAQTRDLRLKRRQYAEEAAHKLPVKLLFPMMLCVMPALFVVVIGPGVIRIIEGLGGV